LELPNGTIKALALEIATVSPCFSTANAIVN
jgi:hypothetical protein